MPARALGHLLARIRALTAPCAARKRLGALTPSRRVFAGVGIGHVGPVQDRRARARACSTRRAASRPPVQLSAAADGLSPRAVSISSTAVARLNFPRPGRRRRTHASPRRRRISASTGVQDGGGRPGRGGRHTVMPRPAPLPRRSTAPRWGCPGGTGPAAASSTLDSPTPNIRRNREWMRRAGLFRAGRALVACSNMSFNSRGGPGSTATALPSASTTQPGAVPHRLGRIPRSFRGNRPV